MDLFSTDPDRPGIFAVGQEAYGVFALGQLATGVVAVGQLARGVFAVGQGAVGVVAIGQGAIGVAYGIAMMGLVGRGLGFVVPVLPRVRIKRPVRPSVSPVVELGDLESAGPDGAWVKVGIVDGRLMSGDQRLVLKTDWIDEALAHASAKKHEHGFVRLTLRTDVVGTSQGYRQPAETRDVYEAHVLRSWTERSQLTLEGPLTNPLGLLLRLVGFGALAAAWWFLAGRDVAAMFGWTEPLFM